MLRLDSELQLEEAAKLEADRRLPDFESSTQL